MPVTVHDIDLDDGHDDTSDRLRGVLGIPDGDGPWPAVVVLHEAWGVDAEMRKQVAHLAGLGYLALMPDLYSDGGFRRCISATVRALSTGHGRAYADIEAARQTVLARPDCSGAVGVLGFCMGGGFALMTLGFGYDAAAVNYGLLPKDLDATVENACPVVTSYGGKDVSLKNATAKLDAALTRAGVVHDSKEYPAAGHQFMNEAESSPALLRPLMRVLNFGPEPASARDAWSRIDAFFGEHLAQR